MGSKPNGSGTENNDRKTKNVKRVVSAFWFAFLGLTLLMALLWFGSSLVNSLLKPEKSESLHRTGSEKTSTSAEIRKAYSKYLRDFLQYLKEKNSEIVAKAWEKSEPEIKRLKEKTLEDIEKRSREVLNAYFLKAENGGVEKFLDWLYSFGTDYVVVLKQAEGAAKKIQCYWDLKKGEIRNLLQCAKSSELEKYISVKVGEYLLNPESLRGLVETRLVPFIDKKLEEFRKRSVEIFERHYRALLIKEAKKFAEQHRNDLPKNLGRTDRTLSEFAQKMAETLAPTVLSDVKKRISLKIAAMISAAVVTKVVVKTAEKIAAKLAETVTVKVISKILAKLLAKVSGKIVTFLTSTAGGVAACSWAGPFSIVCGLAAGVAAWVATDYAINRLDEALSRDELREELKTLLANAELTLIRRIVEVSENIAEQWMAAAKTATEEGLKSIKLKELTAY